MEVEPAARRFVHGSALLQAVQSAITDAKAGDAFAEVWVMAPHARAAQSLSVRLARHGGYVNVRVLTQDDVVRHLLGAEALGLSRLGSGLLRQFAKSVLRGAQPPLRDHHSSTVLDAFVSALRELQLRPEDERRSLAESGDDLGRELVRLYDEFRARIHGRYYDDHDLRDIALAMDVSHPPVVSVVTEPPEWFDNLLLEKLAGHPRSRIVAVGSGEAALDAALRVWLWGIEHEHVVVEAPEPDVNSVRVVIAPDVQTEVDLALGALVDQARAGSPFARLALLFPEPSPHWAYAVSALQSAGIPFHGRVPGSIGQTPVARFLMRTLAVLDSDFGVDEVTQWIAEPIVQNPSGGITLHTADVVDVMRRARVTGGRDTSARLLAFAVAPSTSDRQRLTASATAALLDDLVELLGDAPSTWTAWAARLQACVNRYVGGAEQRTGWPTLHRELAGDVERVIKKLESLDAAGGSVDVASVIDALSDSLKRAMPAAKDDRGVLIGSFSDAVCAEFDLVVLCGLNEGLAPQADSRGALQVSLRVPGQETAGERQRRAFLHARAGAPRVVLSCSRVDQRAQRERLPSPWLVEDASRLAGRVLGASELVDGRAEWPWLQVAPSFAGVLRSECTFADSDLTALSSMSTWVADGGDVSGHPLLDEHDGLRRGVQLLRARDSDRFTRFDGLIGASSHLQALLAEPLSPTRFETWATCPAKFFYASVLRLVDRETDSKQLGLAARDRGNLMHEILETFIRAVPVRTSAGQSWNDEEREQLHRIGDQLVQRAIDAGQAARGLLEGIERRRLHVELDRFLDDDEAYRRAKGVVTTGVEVAFGSGDRPPVEIARPGRAPVRFRGRVDRIDASRDGSTLVVVDYKTGKRAYLPGEKTLSADPVVAGQHVQLAVYAEAVASTRSLAGSASGEAEVPSSVDGVYWCTSDATAKDPLVRSSYDAQARERLRDVVDHVSSGIEAGFFAVVPGDEDRDSFEHCMNCAFDDICVADRDEIWDRKSVDPAAAPYVRLDPSFVAPDTLVGVSADLNSTDRSEGAS